MGWVCGSPGSGTGIFLWMNRWAWGSCFGLLMWATLPSTGTIWRSLGAKAVQHIPEPQDWEANWAVKKLLWDRVPGRCYLSGRSGGIGDTAPGTERGALYTATARSGGIPTRTRTAAAGRAGSGAAAGLGPGGGEWVGSFGAAGSRSEPSGTYPRGHSDRQRQQQQRCEQEDGEGPVPQQGPWAHRGHLLWRDAVRARAARHPLPAALNSGRRGRSGRDMAGGDATRPRPDGTPGPPAPGQGRACAERCGRGPRAR